jgi:acetyl esterase
MRLTPMLLAGVTLMAPASTLAADAAAKQVAPATLPGAETFVYRPLKPDALRVHAFKPAGWKTGDQRPAFIWFFGGGWTRGTPENAAWWAKWAATQGMVGLAPDYRVKDRHGTSPLESVADARAALRWAQEHAAELGIDPQRIVIGGNSAGGHLALWTAIERTPPGSAEAESPKFRPAALILTSAVCDTSKASGYTPTRFGEHAQALSPVHQLDAKMPPVLAFHGDADQTVPHAQAFALRARLRGTGNVCELVSVPRGSHNYGGDQPEWAVRTQAMAAEFLRKQGVLP